MRGLDPHIYDLIEQFGREDGETRFNAFMSVFNEAAQNDNTPWAYRRAEIDTAIRCGDFRMFFEALAGTSVKSIMMEAMLVPDPDGDVWEDFANGIFIATYADGNRTLSRAHIDHATHEVTAAEGDALIISGDANPVKAEICIGSVANSGNFICVPDSKRGDDRSAFWYQEVKHND